MICGRVTCACACIRVCVCVRVFVCGAGVYIVTRCCITCVGRYLELLHFFYLLFSFSALTISKMPPAIKQTKMIYHKVIWLKIMKN